MVPSQTSIYSRPTVEATSQAHCAFSWSFRGDLSHVETAVRAMTPETRIAAQLACALLYRVVEHLEEEADTVVLPTIPVGVQGWPLGGRWAITPSPLLPYPNGARP